MRQIKFRGKHFGTGKLVYGDLIQNFNGCAVIRNAETDIWNQVEPESVAQLIAVDCNGREVYEGDLVVRIADYDPDFDRAKTFPMAATFEDFSAINDGQIILAEAQT